MMIRIEDATQVLDRLEAELALFRNVVLWYAQTETPVPTGVQTAIANVSELLAAILKEPVRH